MSTSTLLELQCPLCGYHWVPRVPTPRLCPNCKRKLGKQGNRQAAPKKG